MKRIIFLGDIARMSKERSTSSSPDRMQLSTLQSPSSNEIMQRWIDDSESQWSPTKEDFDRLIEEQECFEISWREEKKKNHTLEKELHRLKHELKKERKDRMRLEQEINQVHSKVSVLERTTADLERQLAESNAENEELKTTKSLFPKVNNAFTTACQSQSQSQSYADTDVNNNAQASQKDAVAIEGGGGHKKRRSLVSQLIQGFEAAATATANKSCARARETPRRKTFHGFPPNEKCSETETLKL